MKPVLYFEHFRQLYAFHIHADSSIVLSNDNGQRNCADVHHNRDTH